MVDRLVPMALPMSGWRWVAIVPLTVAVMIAGAALLLFFAVAIPFSIAFQMLNEPWR